MSNFIGPALPPNLIIESCSDSSHEENEQLHSLDPQEDVRIGPNLPPNLLQASPEDRKNCHQNKGPPKYMKKQITQSEDSLNKKNSFSIFPQMKRNKKERQSNIIDRASETVIGPSLPPKLRTKLEGKASKNSSSSDDESIPIGPVLPTYLNSSYEDDGGGDCDHDDDRKEPIDVCVIGPRLPPILKSKEKQIFPDVIDSKSRNVPVIGPSLPPHLTAERADELPTVVEEENTKSVIGPVLPSHINLEEEVLENDNEDMYGPALPPQLRSKFLSQQEAVMNEQRDEHEDEDIGPLPEGNSSGSKVQHQLELRARQLREVMAAGADSTNEIPTQRESWMLELPADRAPELGLRPRQFRLREGPEVGDRSVWTDTPMDRERKKKMPESKPSDRGSLEKSAVLERDKTMQQLAEQHSGKRGTRSLMDIHEEKLQAKRKKAEEAGEIKERRPFSREEDLQVNRFDEAQKRSILKKAQHLNDRFSSGESKFL